jgi:3'(2'), 5'-bisphosphate nucleotidase
MCEENSSASEMIPPDADEIARELGAISRKAGDLLLAERAKADARGHPGPMRRKPDGSPVTDADLAAEECILAELGRAFPDWPIISEEAGSSHALRPKGRFFLVDPLDGTRGFLDSSPAYCVLIALIDGAAPIAAAIDAPSKGKLIYSGAEVFVTEARDLASVRKLKAAPRREGAPVAIVSSRHARRPSLALCREFGALRILDEPSATKFMRIAEGEADFYPRFGETMQWDIAAGDAILRRLGGGVFTAAGEPIRYRPEAFGEAWRMPDFVALRHAEDRLHLARLAGSLTEDQPPIAGARP